MAPEADQGDRATLKVCRCDRLGRTRMPQSIRYRYGRGLQRPDRNPELHTVTPEASARERFEAAVPWYHGSLDWRYDTPTA